MAQMRPLHSRFSWLGRPALFLASYTFWGIAFRLIVLTIVTYYLQVSRSRLQDISEVFASYEIIVAGCSALLFVVILRLLYPLSDTRRRDIVDADHLVDQFFPGLLYGIVLAILVAGAFLWQGHYVLLGALFEIDETPIILANVLVRILAIISMVYCEEYLFRKKLLRGLAEKLSETQAVLLTALAYCAVKAVQFELGIMHLATLFLLSVNLGYACLGGQKFSRGAGFWAGFLLMVHAVLGLPILGCDFSGFLLIKYQGQLVTDSRTALFLTGGVGGPLSSFALQLSLLLLALTRIVKNRKIILNPPLKRIR